VIVSKESGVIVININKIIKETKENEKRLKRKLHSFINETKRKKVKKQTIAKGYIKIDGKVYEYEIKEKKVKNVRLC